MSAEGESSNEQNPQQHPMQQQRTQQLTHQDLQIDIHDILNDTNYDHDAFNNFVQTLNTNSNGEHGTQVYPADLQHIFAEADDVLVVQSSSSNPDASSNSFGGDMTHLFNQPHQQQAQFMGSPHSQHNSTTPNSNNSNTAAVGRSTPSPQQSNSNISTPNMSTVTTHSQMQQPFVGSPQHNGISHNNINNTAAIRPTPSPQQSNSNVSTPNMHSQLHSQNHTPIHTPPTLATAVAPQPFNSQAASSTTLLDNITSQLPLERRGRFIQLFEDLQSGKINAANFLAEAKSLLGQQQYQQLENLKSKEEQPVKNNNIRPAPVAAGPMSKEEETRKRHAQIRAEDAQRSMHGINSTPPQKRVKIDHTNTNNIPMQQSLFHQNPTTPQQQAQLQHQLQLQLQQQMLRMQNQRLQQSQQQSQMQNNNIHSNNQIPVASPQLNSQQQSLSTPPPQQAMLAMQAQSQLPPQASPPLQTPPINTITQPNNTPTIVAPTIVAPPVTTAIALPTAATTAVVTQPIFKAPAVPMTPALQVPTKSSTPSSSKAASGAVTGTSTPTAATSSGGGGGGGSGGLDTKTDFDNITDVMAYANIDLKDEEFMSGDTGPSGNILPDGIDRSKMQDFMNTELLRDKIFKQAKCVNIKEIDGDFVSYVALAAQDRVRTLMECMVSASKHRTRNPLEQPPPKDENGHPLFKIQVKQNPKLQIETIQKVARQTELDLDPPSDDEEAQVNNTKVKGWFTKKSKTLLQAAEQQQQQQQRKITVQDAIFVMERDVRGGRGCNQKALLRAYNEYLS